MELLGARSSPFGTRGPVRVAALIESCYANQNRFWGVRSPWAIEQSMIHAVLTINRSEGTCSQG